RIALGLLRLIRVDADSYRLVRRSLQLEVALCRDVSPVVAGSGAVRLRHRPGRADDVPGDPRYRRIDLSAWRHEDRQPALPARQARPAFRPVRFRHSHRARAGWDRNSLDDRALRLAADADVRRICRAAVADS